MSQTIEELQEENERLRKHADTTSQYADQIIATSKRIQRNNELQERMCRQLMQIPHEHLDEILLALRTERREGESEIETFRRVMRVFSAHRRHLVQYRD